MIEHTNIKVMMDYSAEPLWGSIDDKSYKNLNIEDLNLPVFITDKLKAYENLWYDYFESNNPTKTKYPVDEIDKLGLQIANHLTKALPKIQILWYEEESNKNRYIQTNTTRSGKEVK
jgi:hypothetical protein